VERLFHLPALPVYNLAMDIPELEKALEDIPLGALRAFDTLGSTNDEALSWVDSGCPDFSLVIADEQTKGRGRFDRKWITRPGASLAFSLVLTPSPAQVTLLPLFAPLAGIAIWQTLKERYSIQTEIKWPNDILLHRQKCAGILVESSWIGPTLRGVVVGIGINIHPGSVPPPSNQMFPATYLDSVASRPLNRFELLASVLQAISSWRQKLGSQEFFATWQVNLAFIGEKVAVAQTPKPSIIGVVQGIDHQGRLTLKQADGKWVFIDVGDVHLRTVGEALEKENDHVG
jgi:BirA family biotin operon repressor/biotin-[acetyl-CoA-carboxylase] ligase